MVYRRHKAKRTKRHSRHTKRRTVRRTTRRAAPRRKAKRSTRRSSGGRQYVVMVKTGKGLQAYRFPTMAGRNRFVVELRKRGIKYSTATL